MPHHPGQYDESLPTLDSYSGLSEAMIETMTEPLLVLDEEHRVIRANRAFFRHFRVSEKSTLNTCLWELGNGEWDIQELRFLLNNVIPQAGVIEDYRVDHEFLGLGRRIMLINGRRIEGNCTRPSLVLISITDVTDRENALFELEGQKEYVEKLIDSLRESILVLGWDLRVKHANQPFYETFKVVPAETEGRLVYELGNGQWDIPELRTLLEDILPNKSTFDDFDVMHDFDGIGHRHMLLNGRPLDHLNLIVLALEDVTERDASLRRQTVLAREMSHRVKNVLTLVDAIAAQTARHAPSLDQFQSVFHGRITALARSHGQWLTDDQQVADLRALIEDAIETAGLDCGGLELDGPPVTVQPDQTMALNLTLHELCTNALKYGSLTEDTGRVTITWSKEGGDRVRLFWKESGGPALEPPAHKGFGLQLIETLCPFELDGTCDMRFAPDGLEVLLEFPSGSNNS